METVKLVLKYGFIGGIAAVLDIFLLYIFVDFLSFHYLGSAVFSFTTATVFAFIFQKKFTFNDNSSEVQRQLSYFFVISVTGLLIYVGSISFFVSVMGFWYLLAAVIAKFIGFLWNFSLNYTITFTVADEVRQ